MHLEIYEKNKFQIAEIFVVHPLPSNKQELDPDRLS